MRTQRQSKLALVALSFALALARFAGSPSATQRRTFRSISAGQDHTCALTDAGVAYCWGSNSNGQLGIGSTDDRAHASPLPVAGGRTFQQISVGFLHNCGIDDRGTAFCWGSNEYGQLGTGDRVSVSTPTRLSGDLRLRAISAGATHTCGLDRDGTAYCWGGNWHGQIGDGTFDGDTETACCRTRPVRVETASRFSSIRSGGISTCAVATDGRAFCWGNGNDGRLGLHAGDLKDRNRPMPLPMQNATSSIPPVSATESSDRQQSR